MIKTNEPKIISKSYLEIANKKLVSFDGLRVGSAEVKINTVKNSYTIKGINNSILDNIDYRYKDNHRCILDSRIKSASSIAQNHQGYSTIRYVILTDKGTIFIQWYTADEINLESLTAFSQT